mgnify:CR=1 FL=1
MRTYPRARGVRTAKPSVRRETAAEPGSGRTFDWTLAERRAAQHRLILAGGLTPDNVRAAIERGHIRIVEQTPAAPPRSRPARTGKEE